METHGFSVFRSYTCCLFRTQHSESLGLQENMPPQCFPRGLFLSLSLSLSWYIPKYYLRFRQYSFLCAFSTISPPRYSVVLLRRTPVTKGNLSAKAATRCEWDEQKKQKNNADVRYLHNRRRKIRNDPRNNTARDWSCACARKRLHQATIRITRYTFGIYSYFTAEAII